VIDIAHVPSRPLTVATWISLRLLEVAVLTDQGGMVPIAQSMADEYPEFEYLQGSLVLAAIAFGVCVEIALGVVAILVGHIHSGRILSQSAPRLVDVLATTIAIATAIVFAVMFAVPGPPLLGLALLAAVLLGAIFVLVLIVLRSLLSHAVSLRTELDEVV